MTGRPINENRMLAEIAGEKTYRGSSHECGTNERYTRGGACVHCARRVQREQREARKANLRIEADDVFNSPTSFGNPWD